MDYTNRLPVVHKLSSVTGQHIANQCKLICKYGWPETFISDNGQCYTLQAFTSVMQSYNVNHINKLSTLPTVQWLVERYVQTMKSLFYKAKEEGKDFYKCLIIYHNAPLTGIMKSPMQILQGGNARSDLPMPNAARKYVGIQPEVVRNNDKHVVLPTHDIHVGQDVMYQDSTSKHWYPTIIQSLCSESRSYKILTRDGIV